MANIPSKVFKLIQTHFLMMKKIKNVLFKLINTKKVDTTSKFAKEKLTIKHSKI